MQSPGPKRVIIEKAINGRVNCPNLIILGDLNINYSKTRTPDRKALKNMADDFDLIQLVKAPTRVTNKCQSTIDLIFTSQWCS